MGDGVLDQARLLEVVPAEPDGLPREREDEFLPPVLPERGRGEADGVIRLDHRQLDEVVGGQVVDLVDYLELPFLRRPQLDGPLVGGDEDLLSELQVGVALYPVLPLLHEEPARHRYQVRPPDASRGLEPDDRLAHSWRIKDPDVAELHKRPPGLFLVGPQLKVELPVDQIRGVDRLEAEGQHAVLDQRCQEVERPLGVHPDAPVVPGSEQLPVLLLGVVERARRSDAAPRPRVSAGVGASSPADA